MPLCRYATGRVPLGLQFLRAPATPRETGGRENGKRHVSRKAAEHAENGKTKWNMDRQDAPNFALGFLPVQPYSLRIRGQDALLIHLFKLQTE
jgi:hypothetical protein